MNPMSPHQLLLKPLVHVVWRDARPSSLELRQAMSLRARGSGKMSEPSSLGVEPKNIYHVWALDLEKKRLKNGCWTHSITQHED